MFTGICVFQDGMHVSGAPNCIHEVGGDEQGEHKPVGWTAQNADAYEAYLRDERESND